MQTQQLTWNISGTRLVLHRPRTTVKTANINNFLSYNFFVTLQILIHF